ncbi:MAG: ATP-binding protein [Candidatus Omnitrophota bacterium]|nr:ATP-binding protein [Candidatus Omnitrophota bacterium]
MAKIPSIVSSLRKGVKDKKAIRVSLRYKVAVPVFIIVTLMLFMLFQTTFRFARDVLREQNEHRLLAIAEVFIETLKVPLILDNHQILVANLDWMAKRPDVIDVRVEDDEGQVIGSTNPARLELPESVKDKDFFGVQQFANDRYAVSVPINVGERHLGRLMIIFAQLGFEEELRGIFQERIRLAFVMGIGLALMTAGVTWLALRPLIILRHTVNEIMNGDMSARAGIHSFDEIQDLGEAFNEMVSRLTRSLDTLRARTEALEESEEKYRLIVDNASDIIFALTPEGDIVFLNEGFSGCSREELLHEGLSLMLDMHSPDTREKFEDALRAVAEKKTSVTNVETTHIHRRNRAEFFHLTNLTPLVDHDGSVKLIQGVMRDVTELKRIERMKESLVRDVAHELKTPTAKFEMAVSWLEAEMKKDEGMKKYEQLIEMIKNNTDRLMRTITSIMDLTKLESGMAQVVNDPLDLNDVLVQVRQDMVSLCERKGLVLKYNPCSEPLPMKGDRDMLYRLLVNLIGNAIKFTEKGQIILSSQRVEAQAVIEVRDTGMGISKEDLETVFDRFVQKTASSTGIGVGLTISRDIAALHEGRIWAESLGPGKGASFKVEFPLS